MDKSPWSKGDVVVYAPGSGQDSRPRRMDDEPYLDAGVWWFGDGHYAELYVRATVADGERWLRIAQKRLDGAQADLEHARKTLAEITVNLS